MTTEASAGQYGPGQLVVVGVDGSEESVAALRWAAAYTTATGASLRAMMAWHYPSAAGIAPPGVAPESVTDSVRQHMTDVLSSAVSVGAPGLDVDQQIGYGHPAEVLINQSDTADLLVVGNRGHGKFSAMMLGSVSMQCVTHAHCPVVVVRTKE